MKTIFKSSFRNTKGFFGYYKAPLLSGVLFGTAFIPFPLFTWFFALVPLWNFIYQQSRLKKVLIGCFVCQMLSTFIGFNWMIYTFHSFGGMNWVFSFVLLLGFCAIANLYVCVAGGLWFLLVKKAPRSLPVSARLLLFPLLFSIFHLLIPSIFPWNMGYPWLWEGFPGFQTAELWGFRFLNTLFYVFNLLFLIGFKHAFFKQAFEGWRKVFSFSLSFRFDKVALKVFGGMLFLFVVLNVLGVYLKQRLEAPDKTLNVILVQNNVGNLRDLNPKPFRDPRKKSLYISGKITNRALRSLKKDLSIEDIDFILWSEASYNFPIRKKARTDRRLSRLVKSMKVPLITGAMTVSRKEVGNSLVVFDRKGRILKPIYDKNRLLIFGEYFPGIKTFPFLRKLFPYFGSNMTAGQELVVQELEGTRLGLQICYESLFDDLSRSLARKKAQVLLNVTNDSWYGSWQEPYQHLTMSLARAIETRRPFIRSTNTGFSSVMHADGTLNKTSPMNRAWSHFYQIPYYENPPETLFMGWGYYINEIFLSLMALFVGLASLGFFQSRS